MLQDMDYIPQKFTADCATLKHKKKTPKKPQTTKSTFPQQQIKQDCHKNQHYLLDKRKQSDLRDHDFLS